VLSFALDERDGHLEGEVVLSADAAAAAAAEGGWPAADEQLLYAIHGMLHLVGHRDDSVAGAAAMREAERRYLSQCGVEPARAARIVGEANGTERSAER
jgi:probable rRNA maturation factor